MSETAAARQGSFLDPARRVGDTVGALAADALMLCAEVFESAQGDDVGMRTEFQNKANAARKLSRPVATSPRANVARVLSPDELGGRFHTLSERMWQNSEVARWLIGEAAALIEKLPAIDGEARHRNLIDAQRLRRVEALLRLAPNATLGARLDELLPTLRELERLQEGERPMAGALLDGALADPEIWNAAKDAYRMVVGRELEDLPGQAQAVWSGRLAVAWLRAHHEPQPLSADDAARIAEAVRSPAGSWSRSPGLPGHWTDLDAEAATDVLCLIGAHHRVGPGRRPLPIAYFCDRVRSLPLRCLGGVMLIETQGRLDGGRPGVASFLLSREEVVGLDGDPGWAGRLNATLGPHLDEEGARLDYLRLFMNTVRLRGERFQPVESFDALADRATDLDRLGQLCAGHATGVRYAGFDGGGGWLFVFVVCHRQALFAVGVSLTPDGAVQMIDERLLAADVPVRSERMEGLFVVLENEEPVR